MESRSFGLVVEDDPQWRSRVTRLFAESGVDQIVGAASMQEALDALDPQEFAVAFLDLSLVPRDETNRDGLRVLEYIRELGDLTSVIASSIFGDLESGAELDRLGAIAVKDKRNWEPAEFREFVSGGLRAFASSSHRPAGFGSQILRGGEPGETWEYDLLRLVSRHGDARSVRAFLDALVEQFLPLVPRFSDTVLRPHSGGTVAEAEYWSRGTGQGIRVLVGPEKDVDTLLSNRPSDEDILFRKGHFDYLGAIERLGSADRSTFGVAG